MHNIVRALHEHEPFTGALWPADNADAKFHGEIEYVYGSPTRVNCIGVKAGSVSTTECLHGMILVNGKQRKCTLINCTFSSHLAKLGGNGSSYCESIIIDEHLPNDITFKSVLYQFTNHESFFFPKNNFQSETPLKERVLDFHIGEDHYTDFISYSGSLAELNAHSMFFSDSEQVLDDLQQAFETIKSKHEDPLLSIASNKSYWLKITFSKEAHINEIYDRLEVVTNLFAMFYRRPVSVTAIQLIREKNQRSVFLLPSLQKRIQSVSYSQETIISQELTITNETIEFPKVLEKWFDAHKQYKLIISGTQSGDKLITTDEVFGKIMLAVVQLEAINHDLGTKNKKNYQRPIEYYSGPILLNLFESAADKVKSDSIGIMITSLRNEIAHHKKKQKTLNSFTNRQLIDIAFSIELIVLSSMFTNIGIPQHVIHSYQNFHCYD